MNYHVCYAKITLICTKRETFGDFFICKIYLPTKFNFILIKIHKKISHLISNTFWG